MLMTFGANKFLLFVGISDPMLSLWFKGSVVVLEQHLAVSVGANDGGFYLLYAFPQTEKKEPAIRFLFLLSLWVVVFQRLLHLASMHYYS